VADDLIRKRRESCLLVGTMIELRRAALLADEIAESPEFFSYGTNDLTQTTMGLSRVDAAAFFPTTVERKKRLASSRLTVPVLDQKGVGMLNEVGH